MILLLLPWGLWCAKHRLLNMHTPATKVHLYLGCLLVGGMPSASTSLARSELEKMVSYKDDFVAISLGFDVISSQGWYYMTLLTPT